jgi:hypothetical protein
MEKNTASEFDELSLGDLLNGIILFITDQKFSEQQLYKFFYSLSREDTSLANRLRFKGIPGNLQSEPLRRILSFREMSKLLELPMPNPVDQVYRPRTSQIGSLKEDMNDTKVLPKFEPLFKKIAGKFLASLN